MSFYCLHTCAIILFSNQHHTCEVDGSSNQHLDMPSTSMGPTIPFPRPPSFWCLWSGAALGGKGGGLFSLVYFGHVSGSDWFMVLIVFRCVSPWLSV